MLGDAHHVARMQGMGALGLPAGAAIGHGAHAVAERLCDGGPGTDQPGTVFFALPLPFGTHQFVVDDTTHEDQQQQAGHCEKGQFPGGIIHQAKKFKAAHQQGSDTKENHHQPGDGKFRNDQGQPGDNPVTVFRQIHF